ncbi:hypothetical protein DW980_08200 [Bacteroides stercoris]|nr:hypothetical protein DW980_08200 [Bacteroides stercoris]
MTESGTSSLLSSAAPGTFIIVPPVYTPVFWLSFFTGFLSFGSFWLLKQYTPGFWLIPTDDTSSHPSSAVPGDFYIILCFICG